MTGSASAASVPCVTLFAIALASASALAGGPSEGWGTHAYAEERPRYEARVRALEDRVAGLEGRHERLRRRRKLLWSDWSERERERALAWLASSPHYDHHVAEARDRAKRRYELAWQRWATQRILTLRVDLSEPSPTARAARRALWRYDLERLARHVEYLTARIRYDRMELEGLLAWSALSMQSPPRTVVARSGGGSRPTGPPGRGRSPVPARSAS